MCVSCACGAEAIIKYLITTFQLDWINYVTSFVCSTYKVKWNETKRIVVNLRSMYRKPPIELNWQAWFKIESFIANWCVNFTTYVPKMDGAQNPGDDQLTRRWMSVQKFCKSNDLKSFQTPKSYLQHRISSYVSKVCVLLLLLWTLKCAQQPKTREWKQQTFQN